MTDALQTALSQWCGYALDLPNLQQLHVREAMNWREALRAAIAAGETLTEDEQASLETADVLFATAQPTVLPLLTYAGWLDRRPAAHYAHHYASQSR